MSQLVLTEEVHPAVVVLTLNRAEKRNALSTALVDAVCEAIEAIAKTPARVLVIRGAGPVFCAGLDLAEALDPQKQEPTAEAIARLFHTVSQTRLVTIGAVHGVVAAGGAGLMAACDLVVAAEGTRIGYPELLRGLVPALLMTFMIRQINDRHARELLLLGDYIDAKKACEIALVNRVVPQEHVLDECLAMAKQVLLGGPRAVEMTKRLLEEMALRDAPSDITHTLESHKVARRNEEAAEGLLAFIEKRPPSWQKPT